MNFTTTLFVLPPDVKIVQVAELTRAVRKQLGAADDAFAMGRAHSRSVSQLLDRAGVDLLAQFRDAATVPAAITAYCSEHGGDPRTVATSAFPLLVACINSGFLVPNDSEDARAIVPSMEPGARIVGVRVIRCVSLANDSEVYEVHDETGARRVLKIARGKNATAFASVFTREASILRHLGGRAAPQFTRDGVLDGRPYLIADWLDGENPDGMAVRSREESGAAGARELLRLAAGITEAYATLHEKRVVHGDVHHGNILVGARGHVALLDFGLGRLTSRRASRDVPRAGVAYYREPEWARALLSKSVAPPSSTIGEQYSVAALLFLLLTGRHYIEFSLDDQVMLAQIVNEPPQSFADCGVRPWPEVERILARALSKKPGQRFRSMRGMAKALCAVKPLAAREKVVARSAGVASFADRLIARLTADGELFRDGFTTAPTASLQFGASGVAFALYRIACVRDDPSLLALADLWNANALRAMKERGAYTNDEAGMPTTLLGKTSLYHSAVGTHFVEAHLSDARGDTVSRAASLARVALAARGGDTLLDVGTGKAGVLLASANLLKMTEPDSRAASAIRSLGRRTQRAISSKISALPSIADNRKFVNLGILHGWAGVLYAIMRWCDASGEKPPAWLPRRLLELSRLGLRNGKGTFWPWRDTLDQEAMSMPGWCNGSAGFVHLWTRSHTTFGDARYLELAERAAWSAWQWPGDGWDLCCGAAGRSYALLNLHRHTGERVWLDRANLLAAKAAKGASRAAQRGDGSYLNSLIRGASGVAVLCEELRRPDEARMPVFES